MTRARFDSTTEKLHDCALLIFAVDTSLMHLICDYLYGIACVRRVLYVMYVILNDDQDIGFNQ